MSEINLEEWRDIPDYEGYYQASNLGRIKSLERIIHRKNGRILPLKEIEKFQKNMEFPISKLVI